MKIKMWESTNGKIPVMEFIGDEHDQAAQRVMKDIDKLAVNGLDLAKTEKVKFLKGYKNLYELRTFCGNIGYRTIFTIKNNEAWLLDIFKKKGDATPARYLEKALARQRLLNNR